MSVVAHWIATHAGQIDAIGIDALLGLSVWVVLATGALPLGNVGFAALAATVTVNLIGMTHWPIALCAVAGVLASTAYGSVVGFVVAGLGRTQFAVITFAFGLAVEAVTHPMHSAPALRFALRFGNTGYVYAALLLATFAVWRFIVSKEGRACAALAQDEGAATALGIDRKRLRWSSMSVAACIAGVAGVLIAFHAGSASSHLFAFDRPIEALASAIVGGSTSVLGPIAGSVVMVAVPAALDRGPVHHAWAAAVFHAAALLGFAIFLPTGLCSLFDRRIWERLFGSRPKS